MATANNLQFEIISPEGILDQDTAEELILPTEDGEIGVLPGHMPIFTKLREGEIVVKKNKKDSFIAITGGFVEVSENKVQILADFAVRSEKIEVKAAEEARKRAEQILKEKERGSTEDFITAEKELAKAILALKVAEKARKRYRAS